MNRILVLLLLCVSAIGVAYHGAKRRAVPPLPPTAPALVQERAPHRPYRYDDLRVAPAEAVSSHRGSN